jgi:hypothetical protein
MTNQPTETELFRLTIESVGETREDALANAIRSCAMLAAYANTRDCSCSGSDGSASAHWEKVKPCPE